MSACESKLPIFSFIISGEFSSFLPNYTVLPEDIASVYFSSADSFSSILATSVLSLSITSNDVIAASFGIGNIYSASIGLFSMFLKCCFKIILDKEFSIEQLHVIDTSGIGFLCNKSVLLIACIRQNVLLL